MKKMILLILLSFVSNTINAQNTEITTISFGNEGGKRSATDHYYITKDSIIKFRKNTDKKKGIEKTSKINSIENWNNLLNNITINSFKKIKSGKDRSTYCGSNTYIELRLNNGEIIEIMNADTNKMWNKIKNQLDKLKTDFE
ncbi:hypothetical protein [Olleya sp. HaHaR_3_96]|uniref:hypothetical protein n=1 Tax=Olleya sp. HaHaR_3_96 TaxID=2745560 RepID=UPI001C4FBFDD|nr:hypothetical protein [Olleya sp. HaHaR_3_96]QXP61742.1 hypothetical protein H0I26_08975 [Olleya sp. HaHaR_3_96]